MTDYLPTFPIERHRLANGLDVVLQPDSHLPLVAVNLWYHVGSKNERPGKTGFAHLFEHMLFQGSVNVGTNDHFALLQKIGGVANGSTSYDRTNYYETVPSHQLELALWLESDRMGFLLPAMTQEKLDNQREVVMNERRQRVDNQPYGRAFEKLNQLVFPADHPYSWPVIGYMDDIEAARLEDVQHFFETYYRPNNAVLTLAGDCRPERALAMVEDYFGELPGAPPPPAVAASCEPTSGEQRAVLEDEVQLARLYIAYRIPAFGSRGWLLADLLASALTRGKSSPMYRDLVQRRQLAQDVSAAVLPTELESTFIVITTARPETSPDQLLAAVDEHLERAAHEVLPSHAFERCRNGLVTSYIEQLQSLDLRADLLSQSATFLGDPARYLDRLAAYQEATPREVREFAESSIAPPHRVVVTVVPGEAAA
ncbi:MAG: pitrilysin family protein [Acidobacteria bacterium]|nr:pitrilysin family protein [Acidobacteriota bacterium]